eukprot:m.1021800 g.1021800  ORF g.1021800 m.1021800 type:complete len:56 (-) comp24095_c0_seq29:3095-3262(-)
MYTVKIASGYRARWFEFKTDGIVAASIFSRAKHGTLSGSIVVRLRLLTRGHRTLR